MNLFIDYKIVDHPWGGIQTFFKNFVECSDNYSDVITLVKDYRQADVILFGANSRGVKKKISLDDIKAYGKSKALVIHRLDGLRPGFNKFVKATEQYIDGYVFQSIKGSQDYSFVKKPFVVIHNGINQDKFYLKDTSWDGKRKLKCLFVSWSDSLDKGFSEYADIAAGHNMECTFIGRWPLSVKSNFIYRRSPIDNFMLPSIYRKHDVLIFPSRLESCSNVVLEALSSGIPIVYYKDSGVAEIVGDQYGIPLTNFKWWEFKSILKTKYKEFQRNIYEHIDDFSMNKTIKNYLKFFLELKSG